MTRFLIRPGVHCPNLASHVLGLCAHCVAGDYARRYGLQPWLMESFVDTSAYAGTCYKAANWILVGHTKGRGRNGTRDQGKSIKEVYLYPLLDDLRARVGVNPPAVEPLEPGNGLVGSGWGKTAWGEALPLFQRRMKVYL